MNDADVYRGIRVADFSQGIAGPYCGTLLAQYGADVIKIEPPSGDWLRAIGTRFGDHTALALMAGRGKRSLALDLKAPKGQEIARKIIAGADVVIENNRPGVMARLGLDYPTAKALKPDIIYLAVTGYGQSGPYADRPATDTVIQSFTGLTSANLGNDGVPHRVGILVPDTVTALYGFQSVAVALYAKAMGRGGRLLDISLMQAMAAFQANKLIDAVLEPGVVGALAVPSGTYPTADGWIAMAAVNEAQWRRMAEALGRGDLLADPRFKDVDSRRRHAATLNGLVAEAMRQHKTEEWRPRLDKADLLYNQVNSYADLLADSHFQAARSVAWVEQAGVGRMPVAGIPAAPLAGAGAPAQAPAIGEHSRQVLAELGYGAAAIDALISEKVVTAASTAVAA